MPLAVESLDVSGYEVVISSTHAVAKGVRTRWDQLHISYVHTPMRYAWDLENVYLDVAGASRVMGLFARLLLHYLRTWDVATANRVDVFVANSKHVAGRIWKLYRRRARVIYPPVDVDRFIPRADREEFYVTVTRLVPYKRVDLIVRAFARLGRPLVVVGDGPELRRLRGIASANVRLVGWQPDEVVRDYLERAQAFVFAAEEDFGIGPVEAQAAGAPVIAYGRGGALESVVEGETGLFFYEQSAEAVAEAVLEFERRRGQFSLERIRANAERFRKERFQREFTALVEREWERFRKRLERFGRGRDSGRPWSGAEERSRRRVE
jgi:glycosyltransferase involved in cell wall biosynthesis